MTHASLEALIQGLTQPSAYSHPVDQVRILQTHISYVLLAGDWAYKIKKPLDLGFLDFSTLEKRQHCCAEEIRLNRRLAPQVYEEVVAVTGSATAPRLGGEGAALEYAVRMHRFDPDQSLVRHPPDFARMDEIADLVARFHQELPAALDDDYGTPERVFFPMQQNFDQIRGLVNTPEDQPALDRLEAWTQEAYARWQGLLRERKSTGFIRECHGDMHLGNMVLIDDRVVIFDGIEFNPHLRWIDTLNEVAFLVMDLEQAGLNAQAHRFLNGYLARTGDYVGAALLTFYKVYRALVRAKVTAIRLVQPDVTPDQAAAAMEEYRRYVQLAEDYTVQTHPWLCLVQGISGTGKSRLAQALAAETGALVLSSDVERKRLFSLNMHERSGSELHAGLYSAAASERTYTRLMDLARTLLQAGFPVIVDATFLKRAHREPAYALAAALGCRLTVASLKADLEVLKQRVTARLDAGTDPSEADSAVLIWQSTHQEPVQDDEPGCHVALDTSVAQHPEDVQLRVRELLHQMGLSL